MCYRSTLAAVFVLLSTGATAQPETPADSAKSTQSSTLPALFNQLDANDDGLLSRAEANAVPSVADAYDSFDTGTTIQQPQNNAHAAGITLEQFEAGMQAASQSGAFGPAVSGGNHYLAYPDGSRVELESSSAQ